MTDRFDIQFLFVTFFELERDADACIAEYRLVALNEELDVTILQIVRLVIVDLGQGNVAYPSVQIRNKNHRQALCDCDVLFDRALLDSTCKVYSHETRQDGISYSSILFAFPSSQSAGPAFLLDTPFSISVDIGS